MLQGVNWWEWAVALELLVFREEAPQSRASFLLIGGYGGP
jgi:hypothetical protein